MFLEQNGNHGNIINLDHVDYINWDDIDNVEFQMASGKTIIWKYDNEDQWGADLSRVTKFLYEKGKLISVEMDIETGATD